MALEGSVSYWIDQLKDGNQEAARLVFERYFARLEGLARRKLKGLPGGEVDEQDLALSAFASFCHAAAGGRFPCLADRNRLWALLVGITHRKACDYWRRADRGKQGKVVEEIPDIEQVLGREPTPEFAAVMHEECRRLLQGLGDDTLRKIALWKLEGKTDREIAADLDCGLRTVERKLERIRRTWEKETTP
jgi:DNA-directed RNA polymerase specialized sigma24 family protein